MRRSKFDEFMNMYDEKTSGKYTYYYRRLWDACNYAEESYKLNHKGSLWVIKTDKEQWIKYFDSYIREHKISAEVRESVEVYLGEWMVAV